MGQGSSDVVLQTDFRTWLDQRSGVVSKLSWLLTSQLGTCGSKVSLVSWKSSRDISTSSRCSDSLISSCRTHSAVQKSLNFEWVHEECKTFVLNVAQWGLVRSTENLVRTNKNVLLWLDVPALEYSSGLASSLAGTVVDQVSHSFFLGTTKSASAVEWLSIQRLIMAVFPVLGIQCFRSELKRDTRWWGQMSQRNSFKQVSASWKPRRIFLQEFLAEIQFEFGQCLRWGQSFRHLGICGKINAFFKYLFLKIWVQASASKCSFEPEISEAWYRWLNSSFSTRNLPETVVEEP